MTFLQHSWGCMWRICCIVNLQKFGRDRTVTLVHIRQQIRDNLRPASKCFVVEIHIKFLNMFKA